VQRCAWDDDDHGCAGAVDTLISGSAGTGPLGVDAPGEFRLFSPSPLTPRPAWSLFYSAGHQLFQRSMEPGGAAKRLVYENEKFFAVTGVAVDGDARIAFFTVGASNANGGGGECGGGRL